MPELGRPPSAHELLELARAYDFISRTAEYRAARAHALEVLWTRTRYAVLDVAQPLADGWTATSDEWRPDVTSSARQAVVDAALGRAASGLTKAPVGAVLDAPWRTSFAGRTELLPADRATRPTIASPPELLDFVAQSLRRGWSPEYAEAAAAYKSDNYVAALWRCRSLSLRSGRDGLAREAHLQVARACSPSTIDSLEEGKLAEAVHFDLAAAAEAFAVADLIAPADLAVLTSTWRQLPA
jgi:hypothetical protein